jgi:hypothetical protein
MRLKKGFTLALIIITIALLITGCGLIPFIVGVLGNSADISFDISGAAAIAGSSGEARSLAAKSGDSQARLLDSEEAALVKIMSDGTIESALEVDGGYVPDIAFISIGDDQSVYVCFEYYFTPGVLGNGPPIQFVRIFPDTSEYDILWPPQNGEAPIGQIDVWNWWGFDQDPIVKGPNNKLYFKVSEWNHTQTCEHIYEYDPATRQAPIRVTPEKANLYIETFTVDAKGHIFIQSASWDDTSGSYLRYYSPGYDGYKNIYYTSDDSIWVRGYLPNATGDYLVINGYNIRGMDGIIKVNVIGPNEVTYEPLYTNNSDWFHLYTSYYNNWENNTEIIDQINSGSTSASDFAWRDDVKTSDVVDIDKILAKIQPYFYDTPTVKTGMESYVTGPLDIVDSGKALWNWIYYCAEEFFDTYFDGQLMKDYLDGKGLSSYQFDNIGAMLWASNGSLYGLSDTSWWGSSISGTQVVRLLNSAGERDLDVIDFTHGDQVPTAIKIVGDVVYYRYAILDGYGQETGLHRLARIDLADESEEEVMPALIPDIEVIDYDVSDDNKSLYFIGANPQTNEIINGKINLVTKTWEQIDSTLRFSDISVIE